MKTTTIQPIKIVLTLIIVLAGLILFTLIAVQLTSGEPLFDFTAFWIAGKLTLSGGDPYLKSDWIPLYEPFNLGLADNQTFLYPKPILPIFLPFGLLPLRTAAIIWLILTQVVIVASAVMLSRIWPAPRLPYLLPFVFGIFIFRSYLVTLTLGQLGGFLILVLTGILFLWRKASWFWGSMLFSLIALKPSLGFPLIFLASLWFLKNRNWQHFYGLAAGGGVMLVVGWMIDPQWIGKFVEIGSNKVAETFGYHPTLWGLAGFLCSRQAGCTMVLGGLLSIIFFALFIWLLFQKRDPLTPNLVLGASILFSLLLTPYLWVYDQLLIIIPLAILMGSMIQQKRPYLVIALIPVLLSSVSLVLLPIAVQLRNDVWNVLIPFLTLIVFFFALMKKDTIES